MEVERAARRAELEAVVAERKRELDAIIRRGLMTSSPWLSFSLLRSLGLRLLLALYICMFYLSAHLCSVCVYSIIFAYCNSSFTDDRPLRRSACSAARARPSSWSTRGTRTYSSNSHISAILCILYTVSSSVPQSFRR